MTKRIIVVAGEASGDLHGANLVKALRELDPQLEFFGLGGEKMQQAGVKIFSNLVDLAVVGFVEVFKNLRKFRQIFSCILAKVNEIKPAVVILIDYPGFNLRLAREIKKRNIPLIYYISPQVWAWGGRRIRLIKQVVNKMLVVFKFEEELYKKYNIDVSFVGHPLLDVIKITKTKDETLNELGLPKNKLIISLLPGSRLKEVERHLPIMLATAKEVYQKIKDVQFLILKSATLPRELFEKHLKDSFPLKLIEDKTYDCLNISDFALVASGTATLETAILGVPMIVIYKVSFLTWLTLKSLIKISNIGLVNVVAGRKIVPEFLQYNARAKDISRELVWLLENPKRLAQIKTDLQMVRDKLGSPGASQRAANLILAETESRPNTLTEKEIKETVI